MIFQKLKLSQFIRTRPLKFPSREIPIPSRPDIYFQNPIPSRWYLIPSHPDKTLLTGSRPVAVLWWWWWCMVVWWRLLTSLQLLLFASHVTSSTMRNESAVKVSDIMRDGDAIEGVTLWGLPELSGATLSGLAAVSALPLSFMPRPSLQLFFGLVWEGFAKPRKDSGPNNCQANLLVMPSGTSCKDVLIDWWGHWSNALNIKTQIFQ